MYLSEMEIQRQGRKSLPHFSVLPTVPMQLCSGNVTYPYIKEPADSMHLIAQKNSHIIIREITLEVSFPWLTNLRGKTSEKQEMLELVAAMQWYCAVISKCVQRCTQIRKLGPAVHTVYYRKWPLFLRPNGQLPCDTCVHRYTQIRKLGPAIHTRYYRKWPL
jgi:hypothetical protein|uniref:Uncharacterized protein n=1 Tax=Mus musculus TaxID=10090 RepID=Q3V0V2_MOUSE|nr:unnamed protein product [Mus musculus]